MGAQAGERSDDRPQRQVFHAALGLGLHIVQLLRGGGSGLLVGQVGGGGAHQQVAVDGGRYQHALAHFAGQLEDGAGHQPARLLVQQAVVALAGDDGELLFTDKIVHHIGIHARRIHHAPGADGALVGVDAPVLAVAGDVLHLGVESEFHPVVGGVLRHGDGQPEGADDAAGGGVQRRHHLIGQIRFQRAGLVTGKNLQVGHAVGFAPLQQRLQTGAVRLVKAQHQRAVADEIKVQFLGQLPHQAVALHVEPGHPGAGGRVIARVDNGTVGLGGAGADILGLFQQAGFQLIAGQFAGYGTARHTAADHHYIIFQDSHLILSSRFFLCLLSVYRFFTVRSIVFVTECTKPRTVFTARGFLRYAGGG